MGGGSIIINRASVLISAVTDPSFLGSMSQSDQHRCRDIKQKGAAASDEGDVRYMAGILEFVAKHC